MQERQVARRNPIRLADIVDDLLWPQLFASVRLALRPAPLALGLLMSLLVIAIGELGALWGEGGWLAFVLGRIRVDVGYIVSSALGLELNRTMGELSRFVFELPAAAYGEFPISTIVLPIPILLISCVFLGAISRVVAVEYAQGVFMRAREAIVFSLSRIGSIAGAQLGLWVFFWLIVLGLCVGGWVLFSLPIVNTLGAILFPLFIVAALFGVILLLVALVGCPLLIPAVTCEGVDGLDGVQRVFSLVTSNPVRLLIYLAILAGVGAVALFVFQIVVDGSLLIASRAAATWSGEQGHLILESTAEPEEPNGWLFSLFSSDPTAPRSIVNVWAGAFGLLVSAFMISWYASGSTLLFLLLRQATTGQERADTWSPGMIEATMAEARHARASAGPAASDRAAERLGEHDRHASADEDE